MMCKPKYPCALLLLLLLTCGWTVEAEGLDKQVAALNLKFQYQERSIERLNTMLQVIEEIFGQIRGPMASQISALTEKVESLDTLSQNQATDINTLVVGLYRQRLQMFYDIAYLQDCAAAEISFHWWLNDQANQDAFSDPNNDGFRRMYRGYKDNQTVMYDRGHGRGYNPNHGVFTCHLAGTYVFNVQANSRHGDPIYLGLQLIRVADPDNPSLEKMMVKNNQYPTGSISMSTLLPLELGDKVRVIALNLGEHITVLYDSGKPVIAGLNYFSGHLVHASGCNRTNTLAQRWLNEKYS